MAARTFTFRPRLLELLTLAMLPCLGAAHGRLTVPTPRIGGPGIYENDPVPLESESFVCRHANPNPSITPAIVRAGSKLALTWELTAAHVGDCAVFISYDVDSPRRQQRYVKIANLPDCKSKNGQNVMIDIPSVLPAGRAILRWDWKALHVYPTIEFYVQCADIVMESSSTNAFSEFNSFRIIDPPIYPASGDDAPGFRNPWSGSGSSEGQRDFFVTGPACIDVSLNRCELTSDWTRGYTGFGGEQGDPPNSECLKILVNETDTPASITAQADALGSKATWEEICNMNGLPDCNTLVVGDELVIPPCGDFPETDFTPAPTPSPTTPAPTTSPAPTPSPTLAPTAAPTNGSGSVCCFYGECGAKCLYQAGPEQWCGESKDHCDTCAPLGEWCPGGKTPSPTLSPTLSPTPSAGCAELWGQCGGSGWTGPTCCVEGAACRVQNEWYSQCVHASATSGSTMHLPSASERSAFPVHPKPRLRAGSQQKQRVEPHRVA